MGTRVRSPNVSFSVLPEGGILVKFNKLGWRKEVDSFRPTDLEGNFSSGGMPRSICSYFFGGHERIPSINHIVENPIDPCYRKGKPKLVSTNKKRGKGVVLKDGNYFEAVQHWVDRLWVFDNKQYRTIDPRESLSK
jgi:hypothetical protein